MSFDGGNFGDRFNLARERANSTDPEYMGPYGTDWPRLKAFSNITYLGFIDIVTSLWERLHPELRLVPYGSREKYDPELGYVMFSLEGKKPAENYLKPKFGEDIFLTDSGEFDGSVYYQEFDHLIEFAAAHQDPRKAEEILAAFEDFMMFITPELGMMGANGVLYNRRPADRDQTRFGVDVATRSVIYLVKLQRQFFITPQILEQIRIEIRLIADQATPESNEVLFLDIVKD